MSIQISADESMNFSKWKRLGCDSKWRRKINRPVNIKTRQALVIQNRFLFQVTFASTFIYYFFFNTHSHYYLFSRFAELSHLALRFGITHFPLLLQFIIRVIVMFFWLFLFFFSFFIRFLMCHPLDRQSVMASTRTSFCNLPFCASSLNANACKRRRE